MADRDPKTGKFVQGNKASPGRKPRKVEDSLHDILVDNVRAHWVTMVQGMIFAATYLGDVGAFRTLAEYTIGKPPMTLNITATDAKLLADVLKLLEQRNITAADLFNDLLQELAEAEAVEDEQ